MEVKIGEISGIYSYKHILTYNSGLFVNLNRYFGKQSRSTSNAVHAAYHQGLQCVLRLKQYLGTEIHNFVEILTANTLKYKLDYSILIVSINQN